ncbi:MAG: hypothetical protein KJN90_09070 [Gammaproteobacteria bacterium]|nr:hypothetical protein [Gammaproteobacteria bacterium]
MTNTCNILSEGTTRVFTEALITDSGEPDPEFPEVPQLLIEQLPDEGMVYLLGSRASQRRYGLTHGDS